MPDALKAEKIVEGLNVFWRIPLKSLKKEVIVYWYSWFRIA
jgi:hypothetical protein